MSSSETLADCGRGRPRSATRWRAAWPLLQECSGGMAAALRYTNAITYFRAWPTITAIRTRRPTIKFW